MIGQTLGHYEITDKLGQGGMGSVWLAQDSKLGRQVAIKTLPQEFAQDEERLARFEREAKLLASLNHPNIATIYGLEEQEGIRFLVLELVEGDTLAERLTRGAIPVEESLRLALQIAEALEAAHEKGVIHRDLKPANIKVTPEGKVKVLDFGLAKAFEGSADASVSQSPTLSVAATQQGMILGTAAYMAPEQARGGNVDRRADVWAFGVVLFEMLTAKQLFTGPTVSDTLALVLTRQPDWSWLPADTPESIRRLLRRCIQSEPDTRLGFIGDARLDIDDAGNERDDPAVGNHLATRQKTSVSWFAIGVAAVIASAVTGSAVAVILWPLTPPVTRLSIPLPDGQHVTSVPAISRDGRLIAYTAGGAAELAMLYIRPLPEDATRMVEGSAGAKDPFFSPDGEWVAFFANRQLLKAEVSGGSPIPIAAAPYGLGGTWAEDDTIIFTGDLNAGLASVSASDGSPPDTLTTPEGADEGYAHVWPQFLPGDGLVLFTIWGGSDPGIAVLDLETGQHETIVPLRSGARYLDSGHLINGALVGSDLQAAAFDPSRPVATPVDITAVESVEWYTSDARYWFDAARDGTFVYVPGNPDRRTLVSVDRQGIERPLDEEPGLYDGIAITRDGSRMAYISTSDVWMKDLSRGAPGIPVTSGFPRSFTFLGAWLPDAATIVFSSSHGGDWDLYSIPASVAGSEPEPLLKRPMAQHISSVSSEGVIAFLDRAIETGEDLWTLVPSESEPMPFVQTQFNERQAAFSPDGRFLAYVTDQTGQRRVYVEPYPGPGEQFAVPDVTGVDPAWSPDGTELFYRNGNDLMAVAVDTTGSSVEFGERVRLFDASAYLSDQGINPAFAVMPDGETFLMTRRGGARDRINVILNWFEELKERVPV